MNQERDPNRRAVVAGAAAAAAELVLKSAEALAQRKRKPKEIPKEKVEEKPELPSEDIVRNEGSGEQESRLLGEYAAFLKTQTKTLQEGSRKDIVRLLSGIPSVLDPEQHEPEQRRLVYGPFSEFLKVDESKRLPVIPFRSHLKTVFYNLTRTGPHEALTTARMEYLNNQSETALKSLERGTDVFVRTMNSFGAYDVVPTLTLTQKSNVDLHSTRATIIGLGYTHKDAQDKGERQPVFVTGVLLHQAESNALASLSSETSAAKTNDEKAKRILRGVATNAMVFVPALGHGGVSILGRTDSAVGAPLVDEKGELLGILSDTLDLSYQEKQGSASKRVFLVQGPDAIRESKIMAQ
ncbi:hypothetical protein HY417_02305 [Candidatus Kaiserbacteria bacterium]|nr:hypothetical protein [Candidatus Kaiserbacteria bacterium]